MVQVLAGEEETMSVNEIVVGVDGSEQSLTATRWAAREAVRRNVPLRVVLAFQWAWPGAQYAGGPPAESVARQQAEVLVTIAVDAARVAQPRGPGAGRGD
jgi:nucleotide-binding universal stress UspA family protein